MPVLNVRFTHRFEEKISLQGTTTLISTFQICKRKQKNPPKKSFNIYVNYVSINCTFDHTNIHHMIHHMIVFK